MFWPLVGLCVEGLFCGLYSGILSIYLQIQASNKDTIKTRNIVLGSICVLYVLSVAVFVCDIVISIYPVLPGKSLETLPLLNIEFTQTILFGCCNFIAQFILIYRCWIVWGRNIRVVIVPSILTFAFLATWLVVNISVYIFPSQIEGDTVMTLSYITLPLTVNLLVTGLIVFRIFKVFRGAKATLDDQTLGTGGSKLRRIIFILIESGMTLFSIQLARLVAGIVRTDAAHIIYEMANTILNMLTGITPTFILVRTSMGLSFNEEKSMEEFAIETLRFASNHLNSVAEAGSISNVGQDGRKGDDIEVRGSNDINIVEMNT